MAKTKKPHLRGLELTYYKKGLWEITNSDSIIIIDSVSNKTRNYCTKPELIKIIRFLVENQGNDEN